MKPLFTFLPLLLLTLACSESSIYPPQKPSKPTADSEMVRGGDLTMLNYVEDDGGKYYDASSVEKDPVELLAQSGMNLARLRIYLDPGNSDFSPSKKMPKGYQNEEDMLTLALRAKKAGMNILLTFHYSDYWTNGSEQYKPHDWAELSFEELKTAVYDYTAKVLGDMASQGTPPAYVSIGNEIQAGLLYPEGASKNIDNMCALLSSASRAVRKSAPKSKIVVHLDDAGNAEKYLWYFSELQKHNVDYDIIGASYYPFWTGLSASALVPWAEQLVDAFNKDILIMETGYAWNATLPDGYPGQIKNNGPYGDMSPAGQKAFIEDLKVQISKNKRLIGFIYWDPIFIETPNTGWIAGEKNVVSNTALFDFSGRALPALEAFDVSF